MLPERYSLQKFRKALGRPQMFRNEILHLTEDQRTSMCRQYCLKRYGRPVSVLDCDWDTLILLDACRYETLATYNPFPDSPDRIVSRGSHSQEWIEENMLDRELHDTVYITANTNAEMVPHDVCHRVIKTYGDSEQNMKGRFPEHVTDVALDAHENYPNKRIIVHYMQPHEPYLGNKATAVRECLRTEEGIYCTGIEHVRRDNPEEAIETDSEEDRYGSLLQAARDGLVSSEVVESVYEETLDICLDSVQRLLDGIDGKAVISADHGELFGERHLGERKWAHPSGCWFPEVRTVPWLELPTSDRREITADPPAGHDHVEEDLVNQHLRELGYL